MIARDALLSAVIAAGAAQADVPGRQELAAAHIAQCAASGLNAARVRKVHCTIIPEEGTEYRCRYDLPDQNGWKRYTAFIAIDGPKWVWLDGETRCYSEPRLQ